MLDIPAGWTISQLLNHLEHRVPALKVMRGRYRIAIDQEMIVDEDIIISSSVQEIALIPPVSGGRGPWLRLDNQPIATSEVLQAVQRSDCGAVLLFLGCVRDSHQGAAVVYIDYSAYEAMALKEIQALADQSLLRLGNPSAIAIWHRLGQVAAGEPSVAIAVASPHRDPAFNEGRWLIDTLKARVPIWKKEVGPDGSVWIEGDARIPSS